MTTPSNETASADEITEEYRVSGMTCGHCVASVTEEISELESVTGVEVALNAGEVSVVTVRSSAAVDAESIRAAVTEAGYELVTP
ncbi:MAG: heavy-metal-associated domain-containing protein [Micrococcales bacterium]|nr:heavy-metal-associated domain-containing protein [Micrococcales bacterium]